MLCADRERLSKLMMMTTSDNDAEALVAIRKANEMLRAAKATWLELLHAVGVTAQPRRQPYPPPPSKRPGAAQRTRVIDPDDSDLTNIELITEMIDGLLHTVPTQSGFYSFVERMQATFEKKGRLTKSQFDALRRAYERAAA